MNRDGGGKPARRPGRQITEEEAALWHQLGRSLDKVKTKPRVTTQAAPDAACRADAGALPSPATAQPPERPQRAPRQPNAATASPAAPPARSQAPAELDRRTQRQVAAGKVPIDAVLDLHGLHQDAAHNRLRAFLVRSQAKGHRMVLVVTGKGAGADRTDAWATGASPRGVLRRNVPLWLEEPQMRAIVLSYAAAGMRHGGEGALYVRLRKVRGA
jgi:DNA-nicking Smr family endonuclease